MSADLVAHGIRVADIDRLAGVAARTHFSAMLPVADRIDLARYAITVAVLEADSRPGDRELLNVSRDAISRAVTAEMHHHGLSARDPGQASPAFVRYWTGRGGDSWEDALVDAIALGQIWRVLPSWHCRALVALAEHGDYRSAAAALGTTDATFRVRISKARAAFRAHWFAPESAPGMWGSDRRTGRDRPRSVIHTVRARARAREVVNAA